MLPLSGTGHVIANTPAGVARETDESFHAHQTYGVTGNYFAAMGYALQEGRFLTAEDSEREARAAVIDVNFARRYWPQGNAIGQRVFQGPNGDAIDNAFTVVGIVAPVKQTGLTETTTNGAIYYPYRYRANEAFYVVTRAALPAQNQSALLRAAVRMVDPSLPIDDLQQMGERIAGSVLTRRSPAVLGGIFAVVALLLAAIGTYGVLAYAVSQRRREIGVRMALGALPEQVLAQFLTLGAKLLVTGAALGVLGAWSAGRAMQSILFGVGSLHIGVLATAAAVMMIAVVLAVVLPSSHATRVNPTEVLRH